jgi:cytochrome c-type biogenesis protein CcmH/NrfG
MQPQLTETKLANSAAPGQRQGAFDRMRLRPRLLRLLPGLVVVASVAVVYQNSCNGPFIFDDIRAIRDNPRIRRLVPDRVVTPTVERTALAGRPVARLSFAINYALGGLDPWGYHLFNVMALALAALVVFGVIRRTAGGPRVSSPRESEATGTAMAVAVLWSVHPLLTGPVDYLVNRTELLMGLFMLMTLYCVMRGSASRQATRWYLLAVVSCALGMGCKEVMAAAPLVVLLYDRTFLSSSFSVALRRRRGLYFGLACTWLLLAALVMSTNFRVKLGAGFPRFTPWEYALTQTEVLVHYLRLAFWPQPLVLDYLDWPIAIWSPRLVLCTATVLFLVALTAVGVWRRTWWGFAGAWFLLILAPTSSFLPLLGEVAAERRMYLPLIAVVLVAVVLARRGLDSLLARRPVSAGFRRWLPSLLVVLAAVGLGAAASNRNESFRSALVIWSDTATKRPNNYGALTEVGCALAEEGKVQQAVPYYLRAIRLRPDYSFAHANLGVALLGEGRLRDAEAELSEALRLNPELPEVHYNLGLVYAKLGRFDEAIKQFEESLRLAPELTLGREMLQRARMARRASGSPSH